MSWLSDIPVVGNAIDSFLHPEEGYKDAARQMQQMWQQSQAFQRPYLEAGNAQLPMLTGAEGALLDPSALLAKWMNSYQMSPYAQRSLSNAKAAGLDAASSMGLMGSSPALANIQQSSSDIMNKDRSDYLNDLMQKYMTGIGIGQDIYGKGAQTAANLGKSALDVGQDLGAAAYGEANAPGDRLAQMAGLMAKIWGMNKYGTATGA